MRKVLSTAIVAGLLFGIAVPAFAADRLRRRKSALS